MQSKSMAKSKSVSKGLANRQKKKNNIMKPKTIDEFCGPGAGSFKKFIKQKREYLQNIEGKRKARIQAVRTAREFSWALV
jgi:hypothetical protein